MYFFDNDYCYLSGQFLQSEGEKIRQIWCHTVQQIQKGVVVSQQRAAVTPEILLPGWMGCKKKKEKKTEFINTKVTMEKPRKFCAPLSLFRCHFFHLFLSLPTQQPPRQYREFLWKNMTKIWNPFKIFWSFLVYLLSRGAFSL